MFYTWIHKNKHTAEVKEKEKDNLTKEKVLSSPKMQQVLKQLGMQTFHREVWMLQDKDRKNILCNVEVPDFQGWYILTNTFL